MWKTNALAFVFPPVLVLAATFAVRFPFHAGPPLPPQSSPPEIPSPKEWVPFSADIRVAHQGDNRVVSGRLFQAADGSRRWESGPEENRAAETIVDIQNISKATNYLGRHQKWSAAPMDVQPGEWHPPTYHIGDMGLARYSRKLDLAGGGTETTAESGYEVYVRSDMHGNTTLMAPALNFYPVIRQAMNGRRETLSNLRLEDQSPDLFLPPPGVEVTQTNEHRGITKSGPMR